MFEFVTRFFGAESPTPNILSKQVALPREKGQDTPKWVSIFAALEVELRERVDEKDAQEEAREAALCMRFISGDEKKSEGSSVDVFEPFHVFEVNTVLFDYDDNLFEDADHAFFFILKEAHKVLKPSLKNPTGKSDYFEKLITAPLDAHAVAKGKEQFHVNLQKQISRSLKRKKLHQKSIKNLTLA